MSAFRPEHTGPAELFYNETEASKYHSSSRSVQIQAELANRCVELLNLPAGRAGYVLDIGCGSGLSGQCIEEAGHHWVGCDISPSMVEIAAPRARDAGADARGDVMLHDMGQGLPFRPGTFDGAISVSAVQWLSYSNSSSQTPRKRLHAFFSTLYACLKRGGRAALQLYPESPEQMELISSAAMRVGFSGGLVVDYPNSAKAKKYYLCLFAGQGEQPQTVPQALGVSEGVQFSHGTVQMAGRGKDKGRRRGGGKRDRAAPKKSRGWILKKKERQRAQGKDVRRDTKYTGRRRPDRF